MRISAVSDGTSNTIAVIEDAGRVSLKSFTNGPCRTTASRPTSTSTRAGASLLPDDVTGDADRRNDGHDGARRVALGRSRTPAAAAFPARSATTATIGNVYRPGDQPERLSDRRRRSPIADAVGGVKGCQGTDCSWTQNNCGANDEPFAFHQGGCNCVMVDGSVRFLSEQLDSGHSAPLGHPLGRHSGGRRRRLPAVTRGERGCCKIRSAGVGPSDARFLRKWGSPVRSSRSEVVKKWGQAPRGMPFSQRLANRLGASPHFFTTSEDYVEHLCQTLYRI